VWTATLRKPYALFGREGSVGGSGTEIVATAARRFAAGGVPRAVVLVEGISDQAALLALANRQGRDLESEGVSIVPIGGATNISGVSLIWAGSARSLPSRISPLSSITSGSSSSDAARDEVPDHVPSV
jgi:hypothetical protein